MDDQNTNLPPLPSWAWVGGDQQNIPFMYDFMNTEWGRMSPNTVHCKDTALAYFFAEKLFQRARSVLKWKLPESVNRYYFSYAMNTFGYIGLFHHPDFGNLALVPGFLDRDVYYYPKNLRFVNPLFKEEAKREIYFTGDIGEDARDKYAILLNLKGNFQGHCQLCTTFADVLASLFQDVGLSSVNMKLSNVFACDNKGSAQSFKRMFDHIASGEPATFIDRNLFDDEGNPRWFQFQGNMKNNYIIGDLMVDIRKTILLFDDMVGIPSINTEKRERMVTAEAEANQDEARSALEQWLDDLKDECKKAKKVLDFDIDVELRHPDDPVDNENAIQKGGEGNGRQG